ncbi:hypothetical protein BGX38DRAFT_489711 [Terfezia claveryi]|nr:hypothetical protein BGX38DRAFT_489711 [Terfezia claveryi]
MSISLVVTMGLHLALLHTRANLRSLNFSSIGEQMSTSLGSGKYVTALGAAAYCGNKRIEELLLVEGPMSTSLLVNMVLP